jgi:hypothetical protein
MATEGGLRRQLDELLKPDGLFARVQDTVTAITEALGLEMSRPSRKRPREADAEVEENEEQTSGGASAAEASEAQPTHEAPDEWEDVLEADSAPAAEEHTGPSHEVLALVTGNALDIELTLPAAHSASPAAAAAPAEAAVAATSEAVTGTSVSAEARSAAQDELHVLATVYLKQMETLRHALLASPGAAVSKASASTSVGNSASTAATQRPSPNTDDRQLLVARFVPQLEYYEDTAKRCIAAAAAVGVGLPGEEVTTKAAPRSTAGSGSSSTAEAAKPSTHRKGRASDIPATANERLRSAMKKIKKIR